MHGELPAQMLSGHKGGWHVKGTFPFFCNGQHPNPQCSRRSRKSQREQVVPGVVIEEDKLHVFLLKLVITKYIARCSNSFYLPGKKKPPHVEAVF
jgi:hypothetical protein